MFLSLIFLVLIGYICFHQQDMESIQELRKLLAEKYLKDTLKVAK